MQPSGNEDYVASGLSDQTIVKCGSTTPQVVAGTYISSAGAPARTIVQPVFIIAAASSFTPPFFFDQSVD
jgi:hypothetical protein